MLGTLAFGREAMGLGDVHLMGAVGAVLGWFDPLVIFFVAPFIGLAWVFVTGLVSRFTRRQGRELPYGPHLAAATVLLFFARPVLVDAWQVMVPTIPMPQRALEPREAPKEGSVSMAAPAGAEFPDPFLERNRPFWPTEMVEGPRDGCIHSPAGPPRNGRCSRGGQDGRRTPACEQLGKDVESCA